MAASKCTNFDTFKMTKYIRQTIFIQIINILDLIYKEDIQIKYSGMIICDYLTNGDGYGKNCYWQQIGSHIWPSSRHIYI